MPKQYAVVPVEPTDEMDEIAHIDIDPLDMWRRMILAAPAFEPSDEMVEDVLNRVRAIGWYPHPDLIRAAIAALVKAMGEG